MKKQKSLIALLICLAFCLISMFGTWSMLTCNGTVEVNDLKISTSKGDLVRFLEYRPKTATADNPVPAIVYSPGNDSTAESVRLCSSELARRGYAVYVLDLLSAGHSSEGIGNSPTFGFEELIDYVYSNTGKVIVETFCDHNIDPMHVPGVLCANHGPFTWGKDAAQAVYHAVVLEEVAKMALLTNQINPNTAPAPQYVLDKHYHRKHGSTAYYGQ